MKTGNSTTRNIDKPDRMVFDLDPGAGVAWTHSALLTRALLTELGLSSWLKTSGGKGLHVVVPLAPGQKGNRPVRRLRKTVVVPGLWAWAFLLARK